MLCPDFFEELTVGGQTGLDGSQVLAYLSATVYALATGGIVEQALLLVDGVETCVDVAHQKEQRVIEVGGLLILFGKILDLDRVLLELLAIGA